MNMRNKYRRVLYNFVIVALVFAFAIFIRDFHEEKKHIAEAYSNDYIETSFNNDIDMYSGDNQNEEEWPFCSMLGDDGVKTKLINRYGDHGWTKVNMISHSIKEMSNEIPINIQTSPFRESTVLRGLEMAKEEDKTLKSTYGGCGPIAAIGIFDYFSRTFGYSEIMEDPNNIDQQINLAKTVFLAMKTYEVGKQGDKSTLTYPGDYVEGFKSVLSKYGLTNKISIHSSFGIVGGNRNELLEIIKEKIDQGTPVTMCNGSLNGKKGLFAAHYVTVYKYDTWVGRNPETGAREEHIVLGTRVNYNYYDNTYYASYDILDEPLTGIFWYDVNYQNAQEIKASDFATAFVNSNGQGQYFNTENEAEITLSSGYKFNTTRLRCSYIENQYLVMSGIRKSNDASYKGEAYLEFHMNDNIKMIEFDIGLWSNKEGFLNSENETVTVECLVNGKWVKRKVFKPSDLSVLKDSPLRHRVYLKEGTAFRFVVNITPKASDRNKGRVILDNIRLYYH